MKKIIISIAGIIAVVSGANAIDTNKIKTACQASDKTLWVERNKVCIPKNPCKDSKFDAYCNTEYSNLEIQVDHYGHGKNSYLALVEIYAKGHDLSCNPVETTSNYVTCFGDDVMVFKFNDINDYAMTKNGAKELSLAYVNAVCKAIGGTIENNSSSGAMEGGECRNVSPNLCNQVKDIFQKHSMDNGMVLLHEDGTCMIYYIIDGLF